MVSITIPKIKIETDFKLKEALVAMGATEMFTANADLSGIVKAPPLYVSKAAHKAIIERSWSEEENPGYDGRSGRPSEIANGLLRAIIGVDSVLKTRKDPDEENVKYFSVVCDSKESG
ncbi:hypothetical protein NECAME_17997, partial [Necator americanus]